MNHRITALLGALSFASSFLFAAPSANAAERWKREKLAASEVPVVETEPDVAWMVRGSESYDETPVPLPDAELSRPAVDFSALPMPRLTNEHGNAAVIRIRNYYHPESHNSNQWLRFLQSDDASPMAMVCHGEESKPRGVDAHLLEASHPDGPRYTFVEAWIDRACKGIELRRYQTLVKPLAGGVAFAYRTHCVACKPERSDVLHLVIPTAMSSRAFGKGGEFQFWTYLMEHLEIPMGRGTAGTAGARIESASIASWNRILPKPLPVADVELRVETSFATDEDGPTILVATRDANVLPL